jgi:hypothetical protein
MAALGGLLFYPSDQLTLSSWLYHRGEVIVPRVVDSLPESDFAKASDQELIQKLADQATVSPLKVSFDQAKGDAEETLVDIKNIFGEAMRVNGLRATKAIPFEGSADLWHLQPSTFDLNPPRGQVVGQRVVVGIDVQTNDSAAATAYMTDQIGRIKTYLARQTAELETFNTAIAGTIAPHGRQRRARLEAAAQLRKTLQQ